MINPQDIAREHKFETVEIAWTERGYWIACVHGKNTGEFNCNNGRGDTAEEAVSEALKSVRTYREERAAIKAGDKGAKARRVAQLKAELFGLTGASA